MAIYVASRVRISNQVRQNLENVFSIRMVLRKLSGSTMGYYHPYGLAIARQNDFISAFYLLVYSVDRISGQWFTF